MVKAGRQVHTWLPEISRGKRTGSSIECHPIDVSQEETPNLPGRHLSSPGATMLNRTFHKDNISEVHE